PPGPITSWRRASPASSPPATCARGRRSAAPPPSAKARWRCSSCTHGSVRPRPRRQHTRRDDMSSHRVVVVGGGFAGVQAVRGLPGARVGVTLVDRQTFSLFQPLVYQVATGALSPAEIATPLRATFRRRPDVRVLLAEVSGFDLERREVVLEHLPDGEDRKTLAYDTLIVAGGSRYSYFGHDSWHAHAPELKSLSGALEIRSRILSAFEAAEVEPDAERRREWLTFVVVGAGPTGVEMAGQIAE